MSHEPDCIIRIATVLKRTGLKRATLYQQMNDGTFPDSIKISAHCFGWHESAVNTWIANPMFYHVDDYAALEGIACSAANAVLRQGKAFLSRYSNGRLGTNWHSFDHNGVNSWRSITSRTSSPTALRISATIGSGGCRRN